MRGWIESNKNTKPTKPPKKPKEIDLGMKPEARNQKPEARGFLGVSVFFVEAETPAEHQQKDPRIPKQLGQKPEARDQKPYARGFWCVSVWF